MRRTVIPIMIFVIGQLASVAVLVLWIVRQAVSDTDIGWLLLGIFLMVPVIGGASLVFAYWTKFRLMDDERVNFISGVSHELLTPLASLRLYTETMQIRDIDAQKQEEILKLMLEDIERLSGSISGILAASKLERGKAVYHFEIRNLAKFIEEYIDTSVSLIGKAEFQSDLAPDCFCMMDEPAMSAVMNNLIINAIRYSPSPARITIGLQRQGDNKARITVADEGEGLAVKDKKKIFKMFYRASQTHVGTGIGLYSVKQIVKAHKGTVWAQSFGRDKGTTINILLPICQKDEE